MNSASACHFSFRIGDAIYEYCIGAQVFVQIGEFTNAFRIGLPLVMKIGDAMYEIRISDALFNPKGLDLAPTGVTL